MGGGRRCPPASREERMRGPRSWRTRRSRGGGGGRRGGKEALPPKKAVRRGEGRKGWEGRRGVRAAALGVLAGMMRWNGEGAPLPPRFEEGADAGTSELADTAISARAEVEVGEPQ